MQLEVIADLSVTLIQKGFIQPKLPGLLPP